MIYSKCVIGLFFGTIVITSIVNGMGNPGGKFDLCVYLNEINYDYISNCKRVAHPRLTRPQGVLEKINSNIYSPSSLIKKSKTKFPGVNFFLAILIEDVSDTEVAKWLRNDILHIIRPPFSGILISYLEPVPPSTILMAAKLMKTLAPNIEVIITLNNPDNIWKNYIPALLRYTDLFVIWAVGLSSYQPSFFSPLDGPSNWTVKSFVNGWLDVGIPKNMTLGLLGPSMLNYEIRSSSTRSNRTSFKLGMEFYYKACKILRNQGYMNWTFDEEKGSLVFENSTNWINFETTASMIAKAKFFMEKDLSGIAILNPPIDKKQDPICSELVSIHYEAISKLRVNLSPDMELKKEAVYLGLPRDDTENGSQPPKPVYYSNNEVGVRGTLAGYSNKFMKTLRRSTRKLTFD